MAICFSAREILFKLDNKLVKTHLETKHYGHQIDDNFELSDDKKININSSRERKKNNRLVLRKTRPRLLSNLCDQEKGIKNFENDDSDHSGEHMNDFSRVPTIPLNQIKY